MTNLDELGFVRASEDSSDELIDMFRDLEKPEERRRAISTVKDAGVDKKTINALVRSSTDIDKSLVPWVSQYAIHKYRNGEDDIHRAIEEGAREAPEGIVSSRSKFSSTIGIEYEINVPGIFDFTDQNDNLEDLPHENFFVNRGDELLVEQETGPRTFEVISDVYPNTHTAVDAMMKRAFFAEDFVENNDIEGIDNKDVRMHSGDHKTYHPGVHVHVDPEEQSNPDKVESVIKYFAPELSFATANARGEVNGKEVLSTRQAKTLGGGYPKGYTVTGKTIELRMPDIPKDRASWDAVTAICLGIAKYAETQSFAPDEETSDQDFKEYYERIAENGDIGSRTVEELLESADPERFNPDTAIIDALSEGPEDQRYRQFVDAVETGLYVTGYDPDHIIPIIEEHLEEQWERVYSLD